MRRLFFVIGFLCIIGVCNVKAISVNGLHFTFQQPDGSLLDLTLRGDESFHYCLTDDGIPVFEISDCGGFCYGEVYDEEVVLTDVLAHNSWQRGESEKYYEHSGKAVLNLLDKYSLRVRTECNQRRVGRNLDVSEKDFQMKFIGDYKGLVILVEFPDRKMRSEYSNLDFNRLFNSKGYSDYDAIGSVSDYFRDQSYGQFNLTFDVVGPIILDNNMAYYGKNNPINGNDTRVDELVEEACRKVDDIIRFSDYDWDKDGVVDQVFIVYAGYGEHAGAPTSTIWPHESSIGSKNLYLDGVKIETYGCSCELRGTSGDILTGIGTPCHEFSHCLGFPDVYDTDYSGAFGMGFWDIMDTGSYSGPMCDGEVPYGFSAFERWMAGWLTPTELNESDEVFVLRDLETYPDAFILYNGGNRNEFFILENHRNTKWYEFVGNWENIHGLMITHVNYDRFAWKNNMVNQNPTNQRMSIIPADNEYSFSMGSYKNDLFPGPLDIRRLDNISHLDSGGRLYNLNSDGSDMMDLCIVDISESSEGLIEFRVFSSKKFYSPEVQMPTNINNRGFVANWSCVEDAESYIVEYMSVLTSSTSFQPRVQKIENITTNFIRLNWLHEEENKTRYRVKAVAHGIESEWSEYMEVEKKTDVQELQFNEIQDMKIYGIDGKGRDSLTKGVNIVRYGDKILKILIE